MEFLFVPASVLVDDIDANDRAGHYRLKKPQQ